MARGGVPTLKPPTRTIDFGALVRQAWGDDWLKKDTAYEMSNGRLFADSAPNGGPYTGTATGT